MNISLKARNVPKLLVVWIVNVAVFSGIVTGVVDVRDLDESHPDGCPWTNSLHARPAAYWNTPVRQGATTPGRSGRTSCCVPHPDFS